MKLHKSLNAFDFPILGKINKCVETNSEVNYFILYLRKSKDVYGCLELHSSFLLTWIVKSQFAEIKPKQGMTL